jgi:hypothetical protein
MSVPWRAAFAGVCCLLGLGCERARHTVVHKELNGWCAAFGEAERKFPSNPAGAYQRVNESYTFFFHDLAKTAAGIQGLEPGARYHMVLRFAQLDSSIPGWECPAMDRVLLGVTEQEVGLSGHEKYPLIQVLLDGSILVDGSPLAADALETTLDQMVKQERIVDLYREGWRTRSHLQAKRVLEQLVARRFIVALVPTPMRGERPTTIRR